MSPNVLERLRATDSALKAKDPEPPASRCAFTHPAYVKAQADANRDLLDRVAAMVGL